MKRWLALISAALLFVALAAVASAHAKIDHCTPDIGSTVATAPSQVVCIMTEEIDTKQSTMSVFDANNVEVDNKDAHVDLNDPDHKTLVVTLDASKMHNGVFTVKWHTVTDDDNGTSDGTWQFVVGSAAAASLAPTVEVLQEATATPAPGATPKPTSAAPSTIPTTGGQPMDHAWLALAFVGGLFITVGMLLRRQRS